MVTEIIVDISNDPIIGLKRKVKLLNFQWSPRNKVIICDCAVTFHTNDEDETEVNNARVKPYPALLEAKNSKRVNTSDGTIFPTYPAINEKSVYETGDRISENDIIYVCTEDYTVGQPTIPASEDTDHWQLVPSVGEYDYYITVCQNPVNIFSLIGAALLANDSRGTYNK